MINNVTLEGKIVSDIQLNTTKNKNIPVANFRVMNNDKSMPNTLFIDVEAWGGEAEKVHSLATRGDFVVIDGQLRRDCWESKNNEEEFKQRSKIKITATKIVVSKRSVKSETIF